MNKKPRRIEIDTLSLEDRQGKRSSAKAIAKELSIENINEAHKESVKNVKGVGSFIKKSATVLGLFASIVIIGTLYDSYMTLSSMLHNSTILGIVYGGLILAFVGIVLGTLFRSHRDYSKIKRVDKLQEEGDALAKNPSNDVYAYANNLINIYKNHEDKEVAQGAKTMEKELNSLIDSEVMDRVNELILYRLDKIASDKITKYATQTALSTAISPVAFIDAVLILSRSHVMIKEIAKVYGLRPNFLGEIYLIKKVFAVLAFASVTDIITNHSSDLFGTSVLSKLSLHSAQGIANGILVARIGLGVIKSTRPTNYGLKSRGFFKTIYKSITRQLFNKDK